ncbi:MAG: hypothetical protein AABZ47_07740 [Planctomycetota bacterium]
MIFLASTPAEFSEKLRQLGEPIRRDGSFTGVLLILLGVAAVVVFANYMGKLQELLRKPIAPSDPERLYFGLLKRLPLNRTQRNGLIGLARELRLEHPTILLISESLFDRYLEQWRRHQRISLPSVRPTMDDNQWINTRQILFPSN